MKMTAYHAVVTCLALSPTRSEFKPLSDYLPNAWLGESTELFCDSSLLIWKMGGDYGGVALQQFWDRQWTETPDVNPLAQLVG